MGGAQSAGALALSTCSANGLVIWIFTMDWSPLCTYCLELHKKLLPVISYL